MKERLLMSILQQKWKITQTVTQTLEVNCLIVGVILKNVLASLGFLCL